MPKSENPLIARRASTISPIKRVTSSEKAVATPRLYDVASITSLPPVGIRQDVLSLIKHIKSSMFDELPERAGMNSTQISSTLRYRSALPPVVSLSHLFALSTSTTTIERELARLVAQGTVRKISIPGRGKGGTAIGDGVALVSDWETLVSSHTALSQPAKDKYIELLSSHRNSLVAPTSGFNEEEVQSLIMAGFLTTPNALSANLNDLFTSPSTTSSLLGVSSAGYSAPTGTLDAVGGRGVVHNSGGGGSMLATSASRPSPNARLSALQSREMSFSLPNTGAYLKLLANSRAHLAQLLKQISPKWREGTLELLHEKWDGGLGNVFVSEKKRIRGEGNGLLAGKTRKWREFMGLEFDFVLAEALGSGVIELFDTGSVGLAMRMR